MIERDNSTIEQSVWSQLRYKTELGFLTLDQAKHVVDLAAQLIRWRENEIADSLKAPVPARVEVLSCFYDDCDQERVPGSDLCQAHIEFNAAEDARQAARRVLSNFKSADIVAVDHEGKPVHELTEEQVAAGVAMICDESFGDGRPEPLVLDQWRSCTLTPGCCHLHGHDGECDTTDIPF